MIKIGTVESLSGFEALFRAMVEEIYIKKKNLKGMIDFLLISSYHDTRSLFRADALVGDKK